MPTKKYTHYYLHRKAKQAGYAVNARTRTVFLMEFDENYYTSLLIERYKYTKQISLPF